MTLLFAFAYQAERISVVLIIVFRRLLSFMLKNCAKRGLIGRCAWLHVLGGKGTAKTMYHSAQDDMVSSSWQGTWEHCQNTDSSYGMIGLISWPPCDC